MDLAFRVAGAGSLGTTRVAVLAQAKGADGGWLFDMKEEGIPAATVLVGSSSAAGATVRHLDLKRVPGGGGVLHAKYFIVDDRDAFFGSQNFDWRALEHNYELGARWDLRPRLTLSSAVFRLDRKDVHVTDPANPGTFVKSGMQRVQGIEIGLQGEVTRNWYRRYREERDSIERDNRELDRQEGIATTEEYVRPTYGIRNTGPHDVVRPPE